MTGSSNDIQNFSPYPKGDNVKIANGSLTPISGTGSVVCTPNIKLSSVLHVPEFPINLLSISAITKALNYKINFFPDHCIFQDLQTGKRISSGRLRDDLYILDRIQNSGQAFFGKSKDVNQEIIHRHRRLEHPSFFVLKKLYPDLFSRTQFESLFCDVCEYAKHARNSYPVSDNRSTTPFMTSF